MALNPKYRDISEFYICLLGVAHGGSPRDPPQDRATQRTFAAALGILRSTFRNNLRRMGLRTAKGSLEPRLNKERKRGGASTSENVPGGSQEVLLGVAQSVARI